MFGIKDPSALLRPFRNLQQFTEELYAMLSSDAPVVSNSPVTIRAPKGQTGLKIERGDVTGILDQSKPTKALPPTSTKTVRETTERTVEVSRPNGQRVRPEQPARAAPPLPDQPLPQRREPPVLEVNGPAEFRGTEPVRFDTAPVVWDDYKKAYVKPKAFDFPQDLPFPAPPSANQAGTTVFVGKVVSCAPGGPAQVLLYPEGSTGDPSPTDPVEVDLPAIDPTEDLSGLTWLTPIYQFTDSHSNIFYEAYPPAWII